MRHLRTATHRSHPARHGASRILLVRGRGDGNDRVVARMVTSWTLGDGALPRWMGLAPSQFRAMMAFHFPGHGLDLGRRVSYKPPLNRLDERIDLKRLLTAHRAGRSRSEVWIADLTVAACMAGGHLWEDLGLWSRGDLTELMERNFPVLAARNTKNMKWKKFLYKQLCEAHGVYICRSPSCEVCPDYAICYGPEE